MGKKVVCLVLAAVFFVIGIAFAVVYRCLLKETPILSDELLADYYVGYREKEVKFADAAELLNDSDAVFIVEATGERRRTKDEILSCFTVRQALKPYENIRAGEEIWIYEPTTVFFLDTSLNNEELYERSGAASCDNKQAYKPRFRAYPHAERAAVFGVLEAVQEARGLPVQRAGKTNVSAYRPKFVAVSDRSGDSKLCSSGRNENYFSEFSAIRLHDE